MIFTVGFCSLSIGSTSCCTIAYSFNIATWVHLCWVYRWRHKVEKQRSMLLLSYLASVPSSTHSHTDAPDPNQHCHNQHCNLKTQITSTLAKHTCRTERDIYMTHLPWAELHNLYNFQQTEAFPDLWRLPYPVLYSCRYTNVTSPFSPLWTTKQLKLHYLPHKVVGHILS